MDLYARLGLDFEFATPAGVDAKYAELVEAGYQCPPAEITNGWEARRG
ncbi:MAG TPA: hypothetical protein VFV66_05150 [Nonomuraea sp.]|nr:hypothetical protein [Nonomuraea sp.]